MKRILLAVVSSAALSLSFSANAAATEIAKNEANLELWRLDCGTIQVNELNQFSDTFQYTGQSKTLTDSCYLLRHNDELMLWDTGLSKELLGAKFTKDPMSPRLNQTLVDQLQQINIQPEDIDIVGISHYHFDHTGQAIDFPNARLLIGAEDLKVLKQTPPPADINTAALSPWLKGDSPVETASGDHDVFGDGSVTMIDTPGHTPGSYSLLVRLPETGAVLLSGDTVHFNEQITNNNVPPFNTDRAHSLASMDRLYGIAKNVPAKLIIQHEPEHIKLLPAFPSSAR
ncbi:N-acyl homoserine lactonase family protein [uncultured Psychrobacter sp.]|uniref:N-acyl homoserine lactonase family protein n=1 Tax=uncultured Psychrobacter sp. TaxID=259303 RepID=UPI003457F653